MNSDYRNFAPSYLIGKRRTRQLDSRLNRGGSAISRITLQASWVACSSEERWVRAKTQVWLPIIKRRINIAIGLEPITLGYETPRRAH